MAIMPTIPEEVYERRMKAVIKEIEENPRILSSNKELIREFLRELILNNYSKSRIYKNALYLMQMAEHIKVPFQYATKRDIEDIVLWIINKDVADDTKLDYKVVLKRFYRWIGNGEYPECVKWISTTKKKRDEKLPETMLTEEDVVKMIEAADNSRDKAFIAMLWETGARIGELIDMKIKSVEDYQYGKKVVLRGKTGARKISIIFSVPYVQAWIASHPHKNDPDAPLWVNIGTKGNGKKVGYAALNHMLRRVAEKAGINKPINPHHFRHSRATYLANTFTEAQLCQWFGWVQGSRIPATYVHLSGRDLDSVYAGIYGLKVDEEPRVSKYRVKECPRCGAPLEVNAKFCHRCGMALDLETLETMEKTEENIIDVFLGSSNPELRRMLKVIKELYEMSEDPTVRGLLKKL